MNKVVHVNVGGYAFSIDEDAYAVLDQYLETIHDHFSSSDGYQEITDDIESRIGELFRERLEGTKRVVTKSDVDFAIRTMGTPDDFGLDNEQVKEPKTKPRAVGKRLYRDPDNQVVGGVCSGISAYFGIEDPVWLRLLMAFMIFSGVGFMLYVILWAVIPEAKTRNDKLAMRGEPINIENIAHTIQQEVNEMAERIEDWDDSRRKKKARKRT